MGRRSKNAPAKHPQNKRKVKLSHKRHHSPIKAAHNKKMHNWESAVSRYLTELKHYGGATGSAKARCPSSKVRDIVRQTLGYGVAHGVVERRGSNFRMAKSDKSVSDVSTAATPSLTENLGSSTSTFPATQKGRKASILKSRPGSKSTRSRSRACRRSSSDDTRSSSRNKRRRNRPSRVSFVTDADDAERNSDKESSL